MNLELYKSFFFVAQYGSISKAAEHLYITQPAVSRSIKQLEESLGCQLFLRTSKGVILTQEGEMMFGYVGQAFNFLKIGEEKINDVQKLLNGEIRIGVSDTLCKHYLIPYLKLFNTLHPLIKIHVICPTTPVITELVKARKIDFGIINMPFFDDKLTSKSVMKVQDCFVTGHKYKHLCIKMHPLREIILHPILLLEKNSNSRSIMDQYFINNSVSVTPDFELGNMDLLIHFAKNDFGIACVIKNFIEEDLDEGRLFEVRPIEPIPARSIGVTWVKDVPLTKASKELIGYLDYHETSDI